jgi:heme A synthase
MFACTGALATVTAFSSSAAQGLPVPSWATFGSFAHRRLAELVLLLCVLALVVVWRAAGSSLQRRLCLGVTLGVVALAGLGITASINGPSPLLSVVQSSLLHFVLAVMALLVLIAGPWMSGPPALVEDEFRPSLRSIAWAPAGLIAVQIILGSAYRHGLTGVIPHLIGAFVVAGFLALAGLLVATAFPQHKPLRQPAIVLVWMMLAQVVLGVVALTYRAQSAVSTQSWSPNLVLFTIGHILLGSLALAACIWLAMAIRKHVADATAAPVASMKEERA